MNSSLSRVIVTGMAGLAMVVGTANLALADNILNFTQDVSGATPVTATDNGTTTTISVVNAVVDGNYLDSTLTTQNFTGAFLNLTATSSGTVNTSLPPQLGEAFSGSFTITSLSGGGGTNYLSGTFTDIFSGPSGGSTATISVADPPETVSFTSSVITLLGFPKGISFSLAAISPALSVDGTTIAGFHSSITGTFNAAAGTVVPEPASMTLLGSGLVGLAAGLRRKLRKQK